MQSFVSRRSAFAACILGMIAAATDHAKAAPDDAGAAADATSADGSGAGDVMASDGTQVADDAAPPNSVTGDDSAPTGSNSSFVMDDGAAPPYRGGDVFERLCIDNPRAVEFTYSTVSAPYTTPQGCTAFMSEHAAARACLCQNPDCFTLQQQCDALQGCREIQKCGFDTGCTDSNSCYLVQGLCSAPIDHAGTGSVSTALSQLIQSCGKSHNCPVH